MYGRGGDGRSFDRGWVMYATVSRSVFTSRFWSRGLARIRESKLSTLAKKTPTEVDTAVAAEIAGIAACKTPSKVSHLALEKKRKDLPVSNMQRVLAMCYASFCYR